jgi:hypothetical protein
MFPTAVEALRLAGEAKTNAQAALAAIAEHTKVCEQRQGSIISDLKEIKDFLKKLVWAIIVAAAVLAYNTLKSHGVMP